MAGGGAVTHAEFERCLDDAFCDTRFAVAIRSSVHEAVDRALSGTTAGPDARREGRVAGERLAADLVAQAKAHTGTARPSTQGSAMPMAIEDRERRAVAFRAMAGVRV